MRRFATGLQVTVPTTVGLEGARFDAIANAKTIASVPDDGNGRTRLGFMKVGADRCVKENYSEVSQGRASPDRPMV